MIHVIEMWRQWLEEKEKRRKTRFFAPHEEEKEEMKSQIVVHRKWFNDNWTIGELSILGEYQCYTLEDTVRTIKIPKVTAIYPGKYEMVINFSARFQKNLPLLLNTPAFLGVRIHSGNLPKHTEGCILLGKVRGDGWIGESRLAMTDFMENIKPLYNMEKVYVEVVGGLPYENRGAI